MDLFSVVRLAEPKEVTTGTRALRGGETPILQATAGCAMEHALEEEASGEGPHVALDAIPINMAEPREQSETKSSDSVHITKVVYAFEQDSRGTKRKEPTAGDDGASSS